MDDDSGIGIDISRRDFYVDPKRAGGQKGPGKKLGKLIDKGEQAAAKAIASLKRGGKIRRTGVYRLHSGERVLNRSQAKRYRRTPKRAAKR